MFLPTLHLISFVILIIIIFSSSSNITQFIFLASTGSTGLEYLFSLVFPKNFWFLFSKIMVFLKSILENGNAHRRGKESPIRSLTSIHAHTRKISVVQWLFFPVLHEKDHLWWCNGFCSWIIHFPIVKYENEIVHVNVYIYMTWSGEAISLMRSQVTMKGLWGT